MVFLMFGTKNTTVTYRRSVFQLPSAVCPMAESEVLGECCGGMKTAAIVIDAAVNTHKQTRDRPANAALARWKSWDCVLLCLNKRSLQFHDKNVALPTTS